MKKYFVVILLLIVVGCATYHQLMVGPDGNIQDCGAFGQGIIGMVGAQSIVSGCVDNLKKAGYIELEKAGAIGVMFRSDSTYILKVMPNSPAEKNDIKPGDKIIEVAGQKVNLPKDASLLLFGEYGIQVNLVFIRGNETFKKTLIRAPYIEVYGKP